MKSLLRLVLDLAALGVLAVGVVIALVAVIGPGSRSVESAWRTAADRAASAAQDEASVLADHERDGGSRDVLGFESPTEDDFLHAPRRVPIEGSPEIGCARTTPPAPREAEAHEGPASGRDPRPPRAC